MLPNRLIITEKSKRKAIYENSKDKWIIDFEDKIKSWSDFYDIVQKEMDFWNYNERLVRKFLKELIYVIDIDEINDVKKYQEVKEIIGRLYPPRGGLREMYVADEDREKMNKINRELKELKKKITLLD